MATAEFNAHKVYAACHKAIAIVSKLNDDDSNLRLTQLGKLADLSCYIAGTTKNEGNLFLTEDDFALINGHIQRL